MGIDVRRGSLLEERWYGGEIEEIKDCGDLLRLKLKVENSTLIVYLTKKCETYISQRLDLNSHTVSNAVRSIETGVLCGEKYE